MPFKPGTRHTTGRPKGKHIETLRKEAHKVALVTLVDKTLEGDVAACAALLDYNLKMEGKQYCL